MFIEDNTVIDKDFSTVEVYGRVLGGSLTSEITFMKIDINIVSYNGKGGRNGKLLDDLNSIVTHNHPDIIQITEYRAKKDIFLTNYKRINLPYSHLFEVDRQALYIHNTIKDITTVS